MKDGVLSDEEIDAMNKEMASYRKPRKVVFALLDPTGVEVDRHDFMYTGSWGNRIMIEVDGHQHIFSFDGKHRYEINGIPPREDICYCGEKMKAMDDPKYVCMNPKCEHYCKVNTFWEKARKWIGSRYESLTEDKSEEKMNDIFNAGEDSRGNPIF